MSGGLHALGERREPNEGAEEDVHGLDELTGGVGR